MSEKIKIMLLLLGAVFFIFTSCPLENGGGSKYSATGELDTTFDPGAGVDSDVRCTAIQSDGKIIIGGAFSTYNGTDRIRIARLNADGSLDAGFDPGAGANNWVMSTAIQSDGKIIIGGEFTSYDGTVRNHIARLNTEGSLDAAFDPGAGANNGVWCTTLQNDKKIIIGGYFNLYNGTARVGIARIK
jgi:uncharacterized delta-60 repeat protein